MEGGSLKEEIRELNRSVKEILDTQKPKRFKSIKLRSGKRKLKLGYLLVVEIKQNKVVNFKKVRVVDGTIKLDDTYHSLSDFDVYSYQPTFGKSIPLIFQPKQKLTQWNPLEDKQGPLESPSMTHGQKLVMARMLGDIIKEKKPQNIVVWIIVILVIIGAVYYFTSGGFG